MGRRKSGAKTRTTVVVVQDKSGSMNSRRAATISGFNEYIQDLREGEDDVRVTLTQFDTQVRNVFTAAPVEEILELGNRDYIPGGMTALYDAVGAAVRHTERAVGRNDRVLVVIMTDGGENSSRRLRHRDILDLIEDKRADGWEFIFLGAGEESWATGNSLGFTYDNSIFYAEDAVSHSTGYGELIGATRSFRSGQTASNYLSQSAVHASIDSRSPQTTSGLTQSIPLTQEQWLATNQALIDAIYS